MTALIVHMLEEYLTGFAPSMSRTFDIDFTERTFLIVFAFVGPATYAMTAIGLLYRHPLANFMAWFIFIGPGFVEFSHFLFPIFEGGPYHYFFGMGTAVLPMIPGIYGMYRPYSESRTDAGGAD